MAGINDQRDLSKIINFMYEGDSDTVENKFLEKAVTKDEITKFSNTLKAEIIFTRESYDRGQPLETEKIWKENFYDCQDIFKNEEKLAGLTSDISYISKETSGESQKYIYDKTTDICFKIEDTKIGSHIVHSIEYAKLIIDGENAKGVGIVDDDSKIATASDGTKYYDANLNNFSYKTEVVYYSADLKKQYTMSIKEFLEKGKPATATYDEETYTFADYVAKESGKTRIWANIKTSANGLEGYWTWIPRYAYKLDSGSKTADIIFIDIEDKPIDKEKYGETLPEEYTVHESFKQKDGLKGIWISKYQPSAKEIGKTDNGEPQKPDLSNFSRDDTKLIYYTADGKNSIEVDYTETPEQTKEQDGKTYYFYNYGSKIWANVKCQANGAISYWTWIPRYAYKLERGTTKVIFVDEHDKPLNTSVYGDSLPEGYTVHEAFKQKDGLKGIWFSKYQPSK